MSEPGSKPQVDDVLASIRRLVSQEERGSRGRGAAPATGDKLVLTPTFRVNGPDPSAATPNRPAPDAVAGDMGARPRASEDRTSVLPLPPSARLSDHQESGQGPDAPEAGPEEISRDLPTVSDGLVFTSAPARDADDTGGPFEQDTPAFHAPQRASWSESDLNAKIAALRAAVARGGTARRAETAPAGGASATPFQTPSDPWADRDADKSDKAPYRLVPEARRDGSAEEDPGESAAAPDGQVQARNGSADEDRLREIVAEIVREELKGELGARITRNLRKLVRREVRRMLESRQLE